MILSYSFFVREELRGFHLHVQPLYAMGWNFPAHDSVDLKQVDGLRSGYASAMYVTWSQYPVPSWPPVILLAQRDPRPSQSTSPPVNPALRSSELSKLVANAMLAQRVSSINSISRRVIKKRIVIEFLFSDMKRHSFRKIKIKPTTMGEKSGMIEICTIFRLQHWHQM